MTITSVAFFWKLMFNRGLVFVFKFSGQQFESCQSTKTLDPSLFNNKLQ